MLKENIIEKNYYNTKYKPFYDNLHNYLKIFIIPEVIAFYLASEFNYNCLGKCKLKNHINSALTIFNTNVNVDSVLPIVKKILSVKYNLQIINENPLMLKIK